MSILSIYIHLFIYAYSDLVTIQGNKQWVPSFNLKYYKKYNHFLVVYFFTLFIDFYFNFYTVADFGVNSEINFSYFIIVDADLLNFIRCQNNNNWFSLRSINKYFFHTTFKSIIDMYPSSSSSNMLNIYRRSTLCWSLAFIFYIFNSFFTSFFISFRKLRIVYSSTSSRFLTSLFF